MSISTNPMTIFRILTAATLFVVTFFCCDAEGDIPAGHVKIGPEHAIPWRIPGKMTVVVKNVDGEPIVGATVMLGFRKSGSNFWSEIPPENKISSGVTDAVGRVVLNLTAIQSVSLSSVDLYVEADGFSTTRERWGFAHLEGKAETEVMIPAELAVTMQRPNESLEAKILDTSFGETKEYDGKKVKIVDGKEYRIDHVLSGRVVTDDDGAPIEGADVSAETEISYTSETGSGSSTWYAYDKTDADGRYRIEGLSATIKMLRVSLPGRVTETVGDLPEAKDDEVERKIDFTLQPGRTIRLRFVDENDKPIPNVNVSLPRSSRFSFENLFSDAEGRCEWHEARDEGDKLWFSHALEKVGRGMNRKYFSYRIEGIPEEYRRQEMEFKPREPEYRLKMRRYEVSRDKIIFTGWDLPEMMTFHVRDADGKPVPDARCRVDYWENGGRTGFMGEKTQKYVAYAETDANGDVKIDFADCDPEKADWLRITISKPGYVTMGHFWRSDWIRGGVHRGGEMYENATVVLHRGKTIIGRVVGTDRKPISGVKVRYTFGSSYNDEGKLAQIDDRTTETDSDGRWKLDDIPIIGGQYGRLEYNHPDYEITEKPEWGGPRTNSSDDYRVMMKRSH